MALIGASNSLGGITGSNAVARLLVVISGQSSGLETAVAQSEGSLSGLSKNASSIGKTLTRSLTLPLLAIGGLAVKTASDFESAFARVVGISTILDKRFNDLGLTTDTLRQTLLDMANDPSIIATPTDLANALYFAGSAGLKASQALEVVKLSAQGMSVGMGDAADISKVLIFALTNFADTGLTATKAMDILTAAIQEGTAAPEELAIALGRLLPIAKQAGLSFQTTVAAVASLTNLGVPTRVATTSLRALFSELLAPTAAATKRLNELGLSADDLRNVLSKAGLVGAMQLLLQATHGNEDALHDIIPQIRGFTAFVGLTDQQMRRYRSTLNAVENSQGKFNKVLSIIQQTPGFKFEKALQSLKVAALNLGEALLPVFTRVSEAITGVATGFSKLPQPIKQAAAAFIVLGAAIGPLFQLLGTLTATREKTLALNAAGSTMIPTWKAVATGFTVAGIAAVVAFGGFKALTDGTGSLITVITTLVGSFVALQLAIKGLQILTNLLPVTNALTLAFASLGNVGIAAIAASLAIVVTTIGYFIGASKRAGVAAAALRKELGDGAKAASSFRDTLNSVKDTAIRDELTALAEKLKVLDQPTGKALETIVASGGDVDKTLASLADRLSALPPSLTGVASSTVVAIRKFQALRSSGVSVTKALAEAGISAESLGVAFDNFQTAGRGAVNPFAGVVTSAQEAIRAFDGAVGANEDYQTAQYATILASGANAKATDDLAKKLGVSSEFLQGKLNEVGVSAVGMSGKSLDAFKTVAFGSAQADAAVAEAQKGISDSAGKISDALTGAFDPFGDLPKLAAPSIDKVIKKFGDMTKLITTESDNIVALNKRGVPTSLIERAIGAGPGFVARLAGATDSQLKRIVTSYSVALAAMDAEILKEGAHQEVKGNNMVSGFADALLASSTLPQKAAREIILKVTDAFSRGDLTGAALGLVTQFVRGLGHVKGLTAEQATVAVNAFADGLIKGDFLNEHGKLMVGKVVQGMVSQAHLPVGVALQLVEAFTGAIDSNKGKAQVSGVQLAGAAIHGLSQGAGGTADIGKSLVDGLAQGIIAQRDEAVNAAVSVAVAAKAAMLAAMHSSPQLFTYHLGQDLVHQLHDGITAANRSLGDVRPKVRMEGGFVSPSGSYGKPDKIALDLDVRLDRQKAARELAYSARQGF
jgi:TP901 family phage tail tape measure protein